MFKPTLCGGFVLGIEVKTIKPLPKPPKPLDHYHQTGRTLISYLYLIKPHTLMISP
jgi:hypothetical protein